MLFGNRKKLQYEVFVLAHGRWSKRLTSPDREHALTRAKGISAIDEAAEAIRVVEREENARSGDGGTEVLKIDRPEAFRRARFKPEPVQEVDPCYTRDDLFALDARRVMERALRPYLGPEGLTPTEILHIAVYQRQIEQQADLIGPAAHMAARVQNKADGCDIVKRRDQILGWVDEIRAMALRFAKGATGLPSLQDTGFRELAEAVAAQAPDGEREYWLCASVCADLSGHRFIDDKIERCLDVLVPTEGESDPRGVSILDRIFADCILSPESLRDMLGQQVSLIAQLDLCLKIVRGTFTGRTALGRHYLAGMSALIGKGACPDSTAAVCKHMLRALASQTPLDHRDNAPEPEMKRLSRLKGVIIADPIFAPDLKRFQDQFERRRLRIENDSY